ncbi:hypothetical protein RCL1_004049 [Eukaryota sp. TZLM3-RCL]
MLSNFIKFTFVLIGLGLLCPFNSLVSAGGFFEEIGHPELSSSAIAYYNRLNLASVFLMLLVSKHVPQNGTILLSLFTYFLSLLAIPILYLLKVSNDTMVIVVLASASVIGASNGIFSAIAFSLAGSISSTLSGAIMSGQGWAGLVPICIRIFSMLVIPHNNVLASLLFFVVNSLLCLICFIIFAIAITRPAFKQLKDKTMSLSLLSGSEEQSKVIEKPGFIPCFKSVSLDAILVCLCFTITLLVFPGLTSLIIYKDGPFIRDFKGWFSVLLTLTFMVFDLLGRSTPSYVKLNSKVVYILLSIFRLVFVFLFIACLQQTISSWIFPFVVMALFALSNGYVSTIAMMKGADNALSTNKEFCGVIMTIALNIGLFLGANLDPFLLELLKKFNVLT